MRGRRPDHHALTPGFGLVVVADWSAAASRGPAAPVGDRCWVAWGRAGQRPQARPRPEYFRTRLEAERRIAGLIAGEPGRALVGFDFPFGYPAGAGLPSGRRLCAFLARRVHDHPDGANNRFAAAGRLNRERGTAFWGLPRGRRLAGLSARRPTPFPLPEHRIVERRLRGTGIQSVWKLTTKGCVGSQVLTGLPAVHRLLGRFPGRARLWPFETGWNQALRDPAAPVDLVVIAEIWPRLFDWRSQPYEIRDQRQVAALRDWALEDQARLLEALGRPPGLSPEEERICRAVEGWILGAPAAAGVAPPP